jgi:hypothetical protein
MYTTLNKIETIVINPFEYVKKNMYDDTEITTYVVINFPNNNTLTIHPEGGIFNLSYDDIYEHEKLECKFYMVKSAKYFFSRNQYDIIEFESDNLISNYGVASLNLDIKYKIDGEISNITFLNNI